MGWAKPLSQGVAYGYWLSVGSRAWIRWTRKWWARAMLCGIAVAAVTY